jgi:hypothetical protein
VRLGIRDHKVIAAFVDGHAAEGHKLATDGEHLDGNWLGGSCIAEWAEGERGRQIVFRETGSRAAESVKRAVRHHAAAYMLAEPTSRRARATKRRRL